MNIGECGNCHCMMVVVPVLFKDTEGKTCERCYKGLKPIDQECRNCRHGKEGGIYTFCREKERMKHHAADYKKGLTPKGGFPQSHNWWCVRWAQQ